MIIDSGWGNVIHSYMYNIKLSILMMSALALEGTSLRIDITIVVHAIYSWSQET